MMKEDSEMNRIKKLFTQTILTVVIFLLFCTGMSYTADTEQISIYINHQKLELQTDVIDQNGRIMVPLREVFQAMGSEVEWNNAAKTMTARKDGRSIILLANRNLITIVHDGMPGKITFSLDAAPILHHNQMFVSLGTVAEAFDAHVESIGPGQEIHITLPPEKGYTEFPNITDFGYIYSISAEKEKINLPTADTFFVTYKYNSDSISKDMIDEYCKKLMEAGLWETQGHVDGLDGNRAFYSPETKVYVMVTYANDHAFVSIGSKISPDELAIRKILLVLEAKGVPNYERMSGQIAYQQACTNSSITSQYTLNTKNLLAYESQLLSNGFATNKMDEMIFSKDEVKVEIIYSDQHTVSIRITTENN